MVFKMTLHSNSCVLSPPSHLQILCPAAGGLGRESSTEVTQPNICLMAPGTHHTQLMTCSLLLRDTIDKDLLCLL